MRISVLSLYSKSFEFQQLRDEAGRANILCDTFILNPALNLEDQVNKLGDVIIWRTSFIKDVDCFKLLANLLRNKLVINLEAIKNPQVRDKFFQQKIVSASSSINNISSYVFNNYDDLTRSINKNVLSYPFIKPKEPLKNILC